MGLLVVRVLRNTIYRTNLHALGFVIMPDAFGAEIGIDLIDLLALVNCAIGALRFAHITVDAFVGNY